MFTLLSGPGGFFNSPITKVIIYGVVMMAVAGSIVGIKNGGPAVLGYSTIDDTLLNPLGLWRLLTGPWVFCTLGELFFGTILIYIFRLFERRWGSLKYLFFISLSIPLSFLMQLSIVWLIPHRVIWSGPYGIIYASLVQYLIDVPGMMSLNIWKFKFTEKWIVFILCLQLALSSFPHSLIAAICGLVPGLLYRLPGLRHHIHRFVPSFIVSFFTRRVYTQLNPEPFRVRNYTMEEQSRQDTDAQVARTFGNNDNNESNQELQNETIHSSDEEGAATQVQMNTDEQDLNTLMEMGFEEAPARQALLMANGDVQLATAFMLEFQSQS